MSLKINWNSPLRSVIVTDKGNDVRRPEQCHFRTRNKRTGSICHGTRYVWSWRLAKRNAEGSDHHDGLDCLGHPRL